MGIIVNATTLLQNLGIALYGIHTLSTVFSGFVWSPAKAMLVYTPGHDAIASGFFIVETGMHFAIMYGFALTRSVMATMDQESLWYFSSHNCSDSILQTSFDGYIREFSYAYSKSLWGLIFTIFSLVLFTLAFIYTTNIRELLIAL